MFKKYFLGIYKFFHYLGNRFINSEEYLFQTAEKLSQ